MFRTKKVLEEDMRVKDLPAKRKDNTEEIIVKIQALAGYARSCHRDIADDITKLERDAIRLLREP